MKISYISGSTIPSNKANAVHVMKMCQALSRHKTAEISLYGKRGSWLTTPYSYYGVSKSFKLIRSWLGTLPILSGLFRIFCIFIHAGLIKRPDAYYGRDAAGLLLLSIFKIPSFYEAHQIPQGKVNILLLTLLLKRDSLKGVVVISDGLKQDLQKAFPFYKKPILVAHDGATIPVKKPTKIPQRLWLGRKTALQIGYTGSLHKGKGMELIYDIAHLVPEMDFHVLGGSKKDVQGWVNKRIPANLLMHGSKPHSEISSYLAKFDIVLAPYQANIHIGSGADISRWISPMKLFEYMAAEKPIICSDIPVLHEIIQHGRNGLMASPHDPTIWVDALCDLSKSASHRDALAREGLKDIQDKFSWNIRADHVKDFIEHNKEKKT
jgi:glycosyltransferase involved in cell wall biosynthesis